MRLHRFFVGQPIGEQKEISLPNSELFHQLKDVLRFQIGAGLILFDNSGDNSGIEYHCRLLGFNHGEIQLAVIERREAVENISHDLYLFFALIKKSNAEWVIEKGTELGVSNFIPILSDRSEKKNLNFERAEKIIKEAAEQSGKSILPKLHPIQSIREAFNNFSLHFVTFDPNGKEFKKESLDYSKKIGVFIGPEGGWSPNELAFFKKNKIPVVSLGKQILRAETASIAVSALILL